jgi:hypothetical protein
VHKPFRQKDSANGFQTIQSFYAYVSKADSHNRQEAISAEQHIDKKIEIVVSGFD